jgi:hypothetical protein
LKVALNTITMTTIIDKQRIKWDTTFYLAVN